MHSPSSFWPLFGLTIRTPRLTLRYVDDPVAAGLMELVAREGVHDPETMPFSVPWTRFEPPLLQRQGMQHYWKTRAETSPESWELPFAVHEGDRLIGVQGVSAKNFAVTKTVTTGSWLVRSKQGEGIGKEMRAAVLHLGFAGLGADLALTSAFADNPASLGVTRSLGYEANGWQVDDREGKPARHLNFLLQLSTWEHRRRDDIELAGLEPCLPLLGVSDSFLRPD